MQVVGRVYGCSTGPVVDSERMSRIMDALVAAGGPGTKAHAGVWESVAYQDKMDYKYGYWKYQLPSAQDVQPSAVPPARQPVSIAMDDLLEHVESLNNAQQSIVFLDILERMTQATSVGSDGAAKQVDIQIRKMVAEWVYK